MKKTENITLCGIIAALYIVLTWVAFPLAYMPIQLRISEILTLLPFFYPPASVALAVGCIFANIFSGFGIVDIVFGSFATLAAGFLTSLIGKSFRARQKNGIGKLRFYEPILAALPPIVINAVVVGMIYTFYTVPDVTSFFKPWIFYSAEAAISEAVPCLLLGIPFCYIVVKYDIFNKLFKGNQNTDSNTEEKI